MVEPISDFKGKFYFLSNMYPCPINYDGIIYSCAETAYQASKTIDRTKKFYMASMNGYDAKKAGKQLDMRSDWNSVKLKVMEEILRIKFANSALRTKLVATRPREIIEENWWGDTFWGISKGKGENNLGKLLVKIRDESTYGGGLV